MSRVDRWTWGEPIERLREHVRAGGVLALPTESSYGLGVDPGDAAAVAGVFRLKGRPAGSPLGVVAADREQIDALGARWEEPALERLAALWPAPLSLLVPVDAALPACAGADRLAVRVPAHRRLRTLLAELGTPLTATSANPTGAPALVGAAEVEEFLDGRLETIGGPGAILVDDGDLPGGNPSTLVSVGDGEVEILRAGAMPSESLERALGRPPGSLFSAAAVEILADESR